MKGTTLEEIVATRGELIDRLCERMGDLETCAVLVEALRDQSSDLRHQAARSKLGELMGRYNIKLPHPNAKQGDEK